MFFTIKAILLYLQINYCPKTKRKTSFPFVFLSFFRNFAALMKMKMQKGLRVLAVIIAIAGIVMVSFSCGKDKQRAELKASRADSILFETGTLMQYDRMLELVDSFEQNKDISSVCANRWRGVAYYHQNQYQMSELFYRKAVEGEVKTDADQLSYNKSARRLSELLLTKGDYEGALRIAIPAVAKMEKSGIGSDIDYGILFNNIGCCQLNLGKDKEAEANFRKAHEHYANRWKADSTSRGYQEAIVGTIYTCMAYTNNRHYSGALYWIDRAKKLLSNYRLIHDARKDYFDEYQGEIEIMRAVALQGLHKEKEAQEVYERFLQTDYSKTGGGRINANDYLVAAKRYQEAADNYRYLDQALSEWRKDLTLENIQLYLLPKYQANKMSGHRDSTRAVAEYILSLLDSAITAQKNSSTAELATIYQTNEKEAEIARQHGEMSKQRFVGGIVALALIVIFLLLYMLHKRKAQHRLAMAHDKLAEAHAQLRTAYDQLETTTKAKERIESELRIARNIQQSMLPSIFPNREGVDLYGLMSPAKEVGGDLYDYLLKGDHLYVCLGDVSGKGVPASLFMAQAIRMFRALAKQGSMPAEIATGLNDELVLGNESGMFVTMFIALIDLKTGHMDFCNAGHNPPVLNNNFLKMESNVPIGIWEGIKYTGEQVENIKGMPLFIYSDGLNEAENPNQKQFGEEHLLSIIQKNHFDSARQMIETMKEEVEKHRNGATPNDDLTMLCMKIS